MYSREIIDEVISRNDIVDVISRYVSLKKSGSSYQGLCPFHSEKSPSFSVSPTRQLYHCFGCGVGGNVITFMMEYEHCSFLEAVNVLAERVNMELPTTGYNHDEKVERDIKAKLFDINKAAAVFYYKQLRQENGKIGMSYLIKRGLSNETIHKFGLGYAPQNVSLYRFLKDKGYDDDILKESGLFTYERGIHDKFWNRVMFPIMDYNNRVIGFGARVMGDAKPKYLNSPETKLFDKSRNLYGLNFAKNCGKNNLIICEGYMDVIALHQAGFHQAVASLGTSLTLGQARLLKRYSDNILITYDSDEAGVKAALRAIPILKEVGLSVKVIHMQPYKDPDEFIKALGAKAFQERIDRAENSFMYEIGIIEKRYDRGDPEAETNFEREVAAKLAQFPERLERENYTKAVANQYHIDYVGLMELVVSYGNSVGILSKTKPKPEAAPVKKKRESGVRQAEKILLTWMMDSKEIFQKVSVYIKPSDFIDSLLEDVATKLYKQYEEGQVNPAAIINTYETEEEHNEVAALFSEDLNENLNHFEREKTLNDIVMKVKKNSIEYALSHTNDAKVLQELMNQQIHISNIHITL
ncbi:MAG: DNA primase [Lachnospira sp.]|jgi:DNA primase|nr:DNA primase [Lachnospira sp.]